jgi:hypothetical protein
MLSSMDVLSVYAPASCGQTDTTSSYSMETTSAALETAKDVMADLAKATIGRYFFSIP